MNNTVHCFVFDTLADWEHGFAVAGINNTQFHRVPNQWQVRTVGMRRDPVVTSGGVRIVPDLALDELSPSDSRMLILPGGDTWDEGGNTEVVETAREFLAQGVPVAAERSIRRSRRSPMATSSPPPRWRRSNSRVTSTADSISTRQTSSMRGTDCSRRGSRSTSRSCCD